MAGQPPGSPSASVIVLNYNGARWLERSLNSLRAQSIFEQIEIIVADNASPDNSAELASALMEGWPNGRVVQHGANLGFCAGNNKAAEQARGGYLFFLNNDTWLEPDCLEKLLAGVRQAGAQAATPRVLNYQDDSFQSLGADGFDLFGLATSRRNHSEPHPVFMPEGCSYLIARDVFEKLGGFDSEFFMFADETDLSWRLWLAGYRAAAIPAARLHHRGAANVNPAGGGTVAEFRTSDTKRFYANRNGLLVLLKNAQHVLLLCLCLQVLLLLAEALAAMVLVRRWAFIRKAYLNAFRDCWRLRSHLAAERRRIGRLRRHSDWWMLRFLRLRPNRWDEVRRMKQAGVPQVSAR